jgi:hypothetical protein
MPHKGQTGVYFDSDGFRLLGTLFLAQNDTPKPTALLLHGLPGIEKNYDIAHTLRENGWNSLIMHYRGCWGSEGVYTLKTIPKDVHAAIDYLTSGIHPQIDPNCLVLIGHSLGGWAAVLGAIDNPKVQAVAAIAAVTDPRILSFGLENARNYFTPWLPGLSAEDFVEQWSALGAEFAPVEQVAKLTPRPILIIHAEADADVPFQQSQLLFDCAEEPRGLITHPTANHAFAWHRQWLRDQLSNWLDELTFDT